MEKECRIMEGKMKRDMSGKPSGPKKPYRSPSEPDDGQPEPDEGMYPDVDYDPDDDA